MKSGYILIVEDDNDIRELISLQLSKEGYSSRGASSAEQGIEIVKEFAPSLVILDWMLPGMSGRDFARSLRCIKGLNHCPILFVTAKSTPEDIVLGLESGGDDYLTKPFDQRVLLARVKALLRRQQIVTNWSDTISVESNKSFELGPFKLFPESYKVELKGEEISLTKSEFKLMEALLENQGKVMTRSQLIDRVQGEGVAVVGRTVDTHIFGLRKKIGEVGHLIESVRGIGYRVGYWEANP